MKSFEGKFVYEQVRIVIVTMVIFVTDFEQRMCLESYPVTVNFANIPGKVESQDSCPALAVHRLSLEMSRCALLNRISSWTYPDTLGSFFGVNSSPNKGG